MMPALAPRLTMPLLILAIGVFHVVTLRDGYSWYWDDAGYVLHARNIVEGRDYADTGYLPNPHNYIAPRSYPPGLPLLLAPLIAVFGVDTAALKGLNVLILLALIAVIARMIRRDLPLAHRCVVVGAVGLHPMFWDYLHRMMSDLPFVLFAFAALLWYRGAHEKDATAGRRMASAVLAGAATYYSIITRTIGVTLPASFLVWELLRYRRPTRAFLALAVTCGALWAGHGLISDAYAARARQQAAETAGPAGKREPAETQEVDARHGYAYLAVFNIVENAERIPGRVLRNVQRYVRFTDLLMGNLHSEPVQHALFALFVPAAIAGFAVRVRRRFSAVEVFAAVYFAAILPWSWGGPRLLFPIIPLYFLYIVEGAWWLQKRIRVGAPALIVATGLAFGGTYAAKFAATDLGPIEDPWTGGDAAALYRFLGEATVPGEVLIAHFPRQLALFARRSFSAPPRKRTPDGTWWTYMDRIGASHVVVGPCIQPPARPMDLIVELDAFVARWPERLEKAFETAEWRVYRILREKGAER